MRTGNLCSWVGGQNGRPLGRGSARWGGGGGGGGGGPGGGCAFFFFSGGPPPPPPPPEMREVSQTQYNKSTPSRDNPPSHATQAAART